MPDERWAGHCRTQGIHILEGETPERAAVFGFVLVRDAPGVYPIGAFELCGEAVVYPPQTLNPVEESAMLAAATGLAGMWDKAGVLTARFVKQRDGSDFALTEIEEEPSLEAKHLLTLRGLWDGAGVPFLKNGGQPPELLELPVIGVSDGESLYTSDSLRGALLQLPVSVRAAFVGWYDKVLRHDG
ncbi:MAG: hypothetical protein LBH95_10425 [Oscillospiraceae bacterium]|jgi:hypothetical protein|nr:hypothetical protein [Oscillospiraceae bacterium]